MTYRLLCHARGYLNSLPREAKDFPRGGNHSKHMPLPMFLAWLQPIYYNPKLVFIHVNTAKILLVVNTLIKKHRKTATLISSHKSEDWNNCSLKKCISEHKCTLKLLPLKIHFKTDVSKIYLIKEIPTDEHK